MGRARGPIRVPIMDPGRLTYTDVTSSELPALGVESGLLSSVATELAVGDAVGAGGFGA